MANQEGKTPFYKRSWFIILALVFFFPIGLYLMWAHTNWNKSAKWIVTAIIALIGASTFVTGDETTTSTASQEPVTETAETDDNATAKEEATTDEAEAEGPTDEEIAEQEEKERLEKEQAEKEAEEQRLAEEQAAKEEKEQAEKESEEEKKVELTPIEEIEQVITDVVGEESISEINASEDGDGYQVSATFAASDNFTTGLISSSIQRNMVDIALALKDTEHRITYLLMQATLPLTDNTGNVSDGQVMSSSFNGDTLESLNSDNEAFLYSNLEGASDGYSVHPDLRE